MRPVLSRLLVAWIVTAAFAVSAIRFVATDAASHSASDTLRPWLLEVAVIGAVAALLIAIVRRNLGGAG